MEVAALVSAPACPTGIGACSVVPTGLRGRARPLVACMLCVAQVDRRACSTTPAADSQTLHPALDPGSPSA